MSEADRQPAILLIPGGGYRKVSATNVAPVARWLNNLGLHVAIAEYPVAPARHPQALDFATAALELLKSDRTPLPNDPSRVGAMGFSAGGHLAAMLSTIGSTKPDLCILSYPVISFVSDAHEGSVESLVGALPPLNVRRELSPELHVSKEHPPTFIWHTAQDETVPVNNSLLYAKALWRHNVDAELHVFNLGRHGLSLAADAQLRALPAAQWTALCANWFVTQGWATR